MALLPAEERALGTAEFQRKNISPFAAVTKAHLRAAFDALDQFLSDNAVAINNAIPQPARGQLTTEQKALLLNVVITRRYLGGV